jgi:hypothetical protein
MRLGCSFSFHTLLIYLFRSSFEAWFYLKNFVFGLSAFISLLPYYPSLDPCIVIAARFHISPLPHITLSSPRLPTHHQSSTQSSHLAIQSLLRPPSSTTLFTLTLLKPSSSSSKPTPSPQAPSSITLSSTILSSPTFSSTTSSSTTYTISPNPSPTQPTTRFLNIQATMWIQPLHRWRYPKTAAPTRSFQHCIRWGCFCPNYS